MTDPVPKLDVSQIDKFAADLEKLTIDAPFKSVDNSNAAIPVYQRQGYMEKLGHSRKKWFRRFFVLRDSFLLSYNLEKSELTVEPRAAVHLANCRVQEIQHGNRYCFCITTVEKDQFLFALPSEEERRLWVKDLQIARTIIHANMVKLAVENKYLAKEKGVTEVAREKSVSALAIFSNKQYIKKTPQIGGAEGWLYTPGFNIGVVTPDKPMFSKVKWTKHYFILRDSHLLMYKGGDILTKPRGCMYLVGTKTEPINQTEDKNMFVFVVRSSECGDVVELATHSEKYRKRWVDALKISARVTYRDFKLLLKEHELLASIKLPDKPESVGTPLLADDDTDIQGKQLDPGVQQAYTKDGAPILRDPDGKLIDSKTGKPIKPMDSRFNEAGQQLDSFNRQLPNGAVPMFTEKMQPIGVGPDGRHYLPDGTIIARTDPHYDAQKQRLPQPVVDAAGGIAATVDRAIKVRAAMKADGTTVEAVDQLGRTFRKMHEDTDGKVINADGEKVPITTARVVDRENHNTMVDYKTYRKKVHETHREKGTQPIEERKGTVHIVEEDVGEDSKPKELGRVEVEGSATLEDVRHQIEGSIMHDDFVFLIESLPLAKHEERDRLALDADDEEEMGGLTLVVRPRKEIKSSTTNASAADRKAMQQRLTALQMEEEQKRREAEEFQIVLKQIQEGTFLKPINKEELP